MSRKWNGIKRVPGNAGARPYWNVSVAASVVVCAWRKGTMTKISSMGKIEMGIDSILLLCRKDARER